MPAQQDVQRAGDNNGDMKDQIKQGALAIKDLVDGWGAAALWATTGLTELIV